MKNNKMTIATLAGHSALEIFAGAKKYGFKTVAIVQRGREKTYTKYFKNLVDYPIVVPHFNQFTQRSVIGKLKKLKSVFIPHRYVHVYCDMGKIVDDFDIPVFGNRRLLVYEDREGKKNQYAILKIAGVDYPKQFNSPKDIDRLVIVKVKEAQRNYERAFFFATSPKEFMQNSMQLIDEGTIKEIDLQSAVIEEYIVGAQVNFNFFYSPVRKRLELLGTDCRRQTNIDGLIRLPADEQAKVRKYVNPTYIESGHTAVTVKESLLEQAFEIAERIVHGTRTIEPPGIIGPFALQTAIMAGPPKERIVVFDLSLRIPGSPGTRFTPYSGYLFGDSVSFGERIALEILEAKGNLNSVIT